MKSFNQMKENEAEHDRMYRFMALESSLNPLIIFFPMSILPSISFSAWLPPYLYSLRFEWNTLLQKAEWDLNLRRFDNADTN